MKLLGGDYPKEILSEEIEFSRTYHKFILLGYVIMPNHAHLVIHPRDGTKIGKLIGEIKAKSARKIIEYFNQKNDPFLNQLIIKDNKTSKRRFWIPRCYDHNCKTTDTTKEKIIYCHKNPVTAGLVNEPVEWKWSSHNWYMGEENVPLKMDTFNM